MSAIPKYYIQMISKVEALAKHKQYVMHALIIRIGHLNEKSWNLEQV